MSEFPADIHSICLRLDFNHEWIESQSPSSLNFVLGILHKAFKLVCYAFYAHGYGQAPLHVWDPLVEAVEQQGRINALGR